MSLSYYKLALILDADAGGQNGAPSQALEIRNLDNSLASIFSDEDGLNPITQPGAVTDSQGNFEFYAVAGKYKAVSGSYELVISVGLDDDDRTYSSLSEVVADKSLSPVGGLNKGRIQGIGDFEIVATNPDSYFVASVNGFIKPLTPHVDLFGADPSGLSDSSSEIESAISFCNDNNIGTLLWGGGSNYLTTSSVDGLHSIRHKGKAAVTRGSDVFNLNPRESDVNNIYVATSGSDNNDGLSSSEPILTPQQAVDLMQDNYGPVLGGTWKINFADGTYSGLWTIDNLLSDNRIELLGSAYLPGPSPAVIFDGNGGSRTLRVSGLTRVYMENLKFDNVTDNGIEVFDRGDVEGLNIHSVNAGLSTTSGSPLYASGWAQVLMNGPCVFGPCSSSEGAVTAYDSATISLGRDGTDATDSPLMTGSQRGVQARNQSLIKVRRGYVDACTFGMEAAESSRISHENGEIDGSTIGYITRSNGNISHNPSNVSIVNTTSLRYHRDTGGIESIPLQTDDAGWRRVGLFKSSELDNSTVTGTTSQVDILTAAMSLLGQDFNEKGRAFKIVVYGSKTGTSGTFTIGTSGSSSGFIRSLVATSGLTGDFKFEITTTCLSRASGSVDILNEASFIFADELPRYVNDETTDDLSAAQDIRLFGQLSNGSDSASIVAVEVYQSGI